MCIVMKRVKQSIIIIPVQTSHQVGERAYIVYVSDKPAAKRSVYMYISIYSLIYQYSHCRAED